MSEKGKRIILEATGCSKTSLQDAVQKAAASVTKGLKIKPDAEGVYKVRLRIVLLSIEPEVFELDIEKLGLKLGVAKMEIG